MTTRKLYFPDEIRNYLFSLWIGLWAFGTNCLTLRCVWNLRIEFQFWNSANCHVWVSKEFGFGFCWNPYLLKTNTIECYMEFERPKSLPKNLEKPSNKFFMTFLLELFFPCNSLSPLSLSLKFVIIVPNVYHNDNEGNKSVVRGERNRNQGKREDQINRTKWWFYWSLHQDSKLGFGFPQIF